jgi:predicted lipoprotein with Yx(FWY)xxD motif
VPALRIPAFVVVIGLAIAACSAGTSPSPSTATPSPAATQAPSTATPVPTHGPRTAASIGTTKTSLGTILIGPDGKTLYLFEADKTSKPTCSGACSQVWLPLITNGRPVAGSGVKQSLLSTSQRADGTEQVVYNRHPLYSYVGDTKAGDTLGEGLNCFGAGWDVVSPAGTKIEKPGG